MNKNGFSLIEIVFTIIIIGLAVGAITESFIAGSAKSVNIVNEETAVNVAKQEMAALNYCRNGGAVGTSPNTVCSAFTGGTWNNPSSFYNTTPHVPFNPINNECFYTIVHASNVDFTDSNGNGNISISGSPTDFIQTIVKTGWFAYSGSGSCPTMPPASYPYVTLSTVYADY